MMQTQAQTREIALWCETNFKHSDLKGDAVRLKQVLMDLVSNAIKFTPPGGTVHLTVEETTASDQQVNYFFKVSDTGIGIKAEKRRKRMLPAFLCIFLSVYNLPTVWVEHLPTHVAGVVRSEKHIARRHLKRLSRTVHRHLGGVCSKRFHLPRPVA